MRKIVAMALIALVIIISARAVFVGVCGETSHIVGPKQYSGGVLEYIGYAYVTPVVYPKCDYAIDGSCDRHDSRSECTSLWQEATPTERVAIAFTLLVNLIFLTLATWMWPELGAYLKKHG